MIPFNNRWKPRGKDKLLHGTIVALVTPFDAQGNLDTSGVSLLVEHHLSAGVNGFYLCGSTGEGYGMSQKDRMSMVEACVKAVAGRVPVVVMVGACPLAQAIALAAHAERVGADAVSSTVPGAYSWMRGTVPKGALWQQEEVGRVCCLFFFSEARVGGFLACLCPEVASGCFVMVALCANFAVCLII